MTEPEDPYRLPRTVIPSRYDLTVQPDLGHATFSGSEDVALIVEQPVERVLLNAVDLEIDDGWLAYDDGTVLRLEHVGSRSPTSSARPSRSRRRSWRGSGRSTSSSAGC